MRRTDASKGGASFIGSHLAERLLNSGADVTIVDDFSSGHRRNVKDIADRAKIVEGDVGLRGQLESLLSDVSIVFHLAAVHGGRGFIDTNPAAVLGNMAMDWQVFSQCADSNVGRVIHASSACAYPIQLQEDPASAVLLEEREAGFGKPGQAYPDGAYGWAKLMGEYQLETICHASAGMTGRSARIFTAYGSRENESHAMVALVAKALLRMDPFPVWGDGTQTRNFTHVSDTVHGLMLLGIDRRDVPFDVMNVGTDMHHSILDTLEVIFETVEWRPSELDLQVNMPVGVRARAASNVKMLDVFGWCPSVSLHECVAELVDWYREERLPSMDVPQLEARLLTR